MWFIGKYFSYERAGWIAVSLTVLFLGYIGVKSYGVKQFLIESLSVISIIGFSGIMTFSAFFLMHKILNSLTDNYD